MTYTVIDQFQQKFGAAVSIAVSHPQYCLQMGIMSMSHKFFSYCKITVFPNNLTEYLSACFVPGIVLRSGIK